MRYRNIKTGAVIDSPSVIVGKSWERIDNKTTENKNTTEEYTEEEINLEEMTIKELEIFAKEHGIEFTSDDKENKETRIIAIAKAFE